MLRICVVGDYDPANVTHTASTAALQHAGARVGHSVDVDWVPTVAITAVDTPRIAGADALLIAPGSPYRSMDGALSAITYARTRDVPAARHMRRLPAHRRGVLAQRARAPDAEHAESSPDATTQVITPLTCSLFGQRMDVEVRPGTKAFAAYGRSETTERYYCNFGLNPDIRGAARTGGLVVSGISQDGEVRILEHPSLRFFVGTLFVPQTSSAAGDPHPLVLALVDAAVANVNAPNEPIAQTLTR